MPENASDLDIDDVPEDDANQNDDSSDKKDSFENKTKSSVDSNNPYEDRVVGTVGINGKEIRI